MFCTGTVNRSQWKCEQKTKSIRQTTFHSLAIKQAQDFFNYILLQKDLFYTDVHISISYIPLHLH